MKRTIYVLVETRNDTDETGRWYYSSHEMAAATGRTFAMGIMPPTGKGRKEQMDRVFKELMVNGRSSLGQYDWTITKAEVY